MLPYTVYSFHFDQRYRNEKKYTIELQDLVCSVAEQPQSFTSKSFQKFSLEEIHDYILNSHDYYRNSWIPKLDLALQNVLSGNKKVARIIEIFYWRFKQELLLHMDIEEKILLPFADKQVYGNGNCDGARKLLYAFLNSHDDHILLDTEKIFGEFEKLDSELQFDMSYRIFKSEFTYFQSDLNAHARIEDEVYVGKILERINSAPLKVT